MYFFLSNFHFLFGAASDIIQNLFLTDPMAETYHKENSVVLIKKLLQLQDVLVTRGIKSCVICNNIKTNSHIRYLLYFFVFGKVNYYDKEQVGVKGVCGKVYTDKNERRSQ